jgi:hypothetical protein
LRGRKIYSRNPGFNESAYDFILNENKHYITLFGVIETV